MWFSSMLLPRARAAWELAVTLDIQPPTPVSCPPHYWLIERQSLHTQAWTCYRCGAEQHHEDAVKGLSRWVRPVRPLTGLSNGDQLKPPTS